MPVVQPASAAQVNVSPPNPGPQPALLPAPGEFVSAPLYRALDTRNGTGESGGAAQLGAGKSLAVAVTGVDGVPTDATSVVVNVVALNTTTSGYLTTYDSDVADPNVASVGVKAGISTNQTDTIPVSSNGTVSVTNHSSAPLDVVMTLMGYYTGPSDTSAGDTYGNAPWIKIVDTTSGLGTSQAPIPAGGSITVQVGGHGGIAVGADTAVVQLSAMNASNNGYLTAYAAGTTDAGVSALFYDNSMTYRDLSYVPLSSAGKMTITNHGSAAVDVTVVTRGYFMPPPTTPVGAEYVPVGTDSPVVVFGTSSGGTQVAANSSVTFQVAGAAGLPATGVVEVAEHVVVTNPAKGGYLDVYRGDGIDPNNATLNFLAGDGTDVGYQDSILSQVSPTGQETITNHSTGTVNVQVAVVGMFFDALVPPVPSYLQTAATYSTSPVLSGIVQDSTGDDLTGEIFLFDSAGNPIGGSPTATGTVSTGEAVTWSVPDGTVSNGSTYQWYMETCDQGVCSAPSQTQIFTVNTANAPQPPTATTTATVTGSQITGTDAIIDVRACNGSDCPTASNGTLNAGYDGTHNWSFGLKLNLSSIPAGSTIISASLALTQSGCLTGSSCTSSVIDVYPANSDVATMATGPQLAAAAVPNPYTAATPATQGTWDITGIVSAWQSGASPNDGLVVQAPTSGTAGISYYSPSANVTAADLPQVTIGYIPPVAPSTPGNLQVTPGDGGALLSWSNPAWNYTDDTQVSTMSFTVQARDANGNVVSTQTTTETHAVVTGLTNGSSYTFAVSATNPIGTGPTATTGAVTPAAVPGGPSQYFAAVSQYLNAQDSLNSATVSTAAQALSGASMASADITSLSNENLADSISAAQWAANDEQMSSDATSIANSLAMLSPDGETVTVYTTATESYTVTDTSGPTQSTTGGGTTDYLFSFANPTSGPVVTGYVDADAALSTSNPGNETAFSAVLDGPAMTAANNNAPSPIPLDSSGQMTSGNEASGYTPCPPGQIVNCAKTANWAKANLKSYPINFPDDCTDFASAALAYGGGMQYVHQQLKDSANDLWWYNVNDGNGVIEFYSHSWSVAHDLAMFFKNYDAYFLRFGRASASTTNVRPGMIIFAAIGGGWFGAIDHTGVVVKVLNRNVMIAQHTKNLIEPLWRTSQQRGWFGKSPHLQHVWIADPSFLP
jgi:hypothetical protein